MAPERSPQRVLLVDDEPCIRALQSARLRHLGVDVEPCASALEALETLDAEPPDLILSDIVMPKLDGLEFCRRVKGNPATRQVVFAICSALGRDVRERSLEAGADDFVPKSIDNPAFDIRLRLLLNLASRPGAVPAAQARILVASADAFVRSQIASHLAPEPWEKSWAADPGDLKDALQAGPPDLLILDLALPGLCPEERIRELRASPRGDTLPILVLVSREQMPLLDALGPQIQDYLPKPLNAAETRHRVGLLFRLLGLPASTAG
jgi:DNA-binding response OmpR family regulator